MLDALLSRRQAISHQLLGSAQVDSTQRQHDAPLLLMPETPEVLIAVMGPTGSGKSTFINLVSGSRVAVGRGLRSCTSAVETVPSFKLGGRLVTLVDTPGFDDTTVSDTDVLKMISVYLSATYQGDMKLSGLIYMHRISDNRMGGIARRNFSMFRKLCGDETLENVIIVTNMWSQVTPEEGNAREAELRNDNLLFKPVLAKGAGMLRHNNTAEGSSLRELVDEKKDITQTAAGAELDRELVKLMEKHKREMAETQEQLARAIAEKDLETKDELEAVRKELEDNMRQIEADRDRLSREYRQEQARADREMNALKAALEAEKAERVKRQKETERLQDQLAHDTQASAEERAQMMRRIEELQQGIGGYFAKLGRCIDRLFEK